MGLFSKKKEMPLASDPYQGSQSPFDLKDVPPPPPSLQEPIGTPTPPQGPQMPPMFPPEFGSQQPELPVFDSPQSYSSPIPSPPPAASQPGFIPPAPSASGPAVPKPQPEPGFELPDFDDEEIRKLEQEEIAAEQAKEEPLSKEEPALKSWPEEEPARPFAEYEQITGPIGNFSYPEEEKPAEPQSERFLDLKTLFSIKDEIEGLKILFRGFDESIENYASKAKLEKYHSLGNTLNNIQDKIMIIDSKLFEP